MAEQKLGWFTTAGRLGDRTLEQQLLGLDRLFAGCKGKTVLDVGCAEGLISIELARRGAAAVHGVEIVERHVVVGNKLRGDLPVTFEVGDLNTWRPRRQYDTVIALALLHKLRNPTAACAALADAARSLVVLRLPPVDEFVIVDDRSNREPHFVGDVLLKRGFTLAHQTRGPFNELVGYFERA